MITSETFLASNLRQIHIPLEDNADVEHRQTCEFILQIHMAHPQNLVGNGGGLCLQHVQTSDNLQVGQIGFGRKNIASLRHFATAIYKALFAVTKHNLSLTFGFT